MNKNILNIYSKIVIDDRSFDRLKAFARSRNLNIPEHTQLNMSLFERYDNSREHINASLQPTGVPGFRTIPITRDAIKNNFYGAVRALFETSTIDPIYNFIFKYHIFTDQNSKDKALDSLKNLLDTIKKAYDVIEEPEDKRYFDSDYNFIFMNITMGLATRIEKRLEDIEQMGPASTFNEQQYGVYEILSKYDLL